MEIEEYDPYCKLCGGCGESGCCTHIGCFRALVEANPNCSYGQNYLADAWEYKIITRIAYRLVDRLKNKEGYTKEKFIEEFERFTDKVYDNRYK